MRALIVIFTFFYALYGFSSAYHIIDDPKEAIAFRLAVTTSAKRSIYSSKFIFKNDEMGLSTLATMRAKAREIKANGHEPDIKLLFDSTGSIGMPVEVLLHLEKEGVEIRFYNDIFSLKKSIYNISRIGLEYVTNRMHDKLLIVDNKHVISGGRNIQDSYYSIGSKNYLDRDIYASREAAWDASEHFIEMWISKAVTRFDFGLGSLMKCYDKFDRSLLLLEKITEDEVKSCKLQLAEDGEKILDEVEKKIEERISEVEVDVEGAVKTIDSINHDKNVEFIGDAIDNKGRYQAVLSTKLVEIASKAQKSLLIETPYLIPDKRMFALFKSLLDKGVKITVITNSLKSTDGLQAFAGYYKYRKKLVNLGEGENQIKLYEYMGSPLGDYLHAKSAVIDDEIALIGSYNLDPRSDRRNTEVMFVARDLESAKTLYKSIITHTLYSLPVGRNGNPQNGWDAFPGASFKKRLQVKFYEGILKNPIIGPGIESQL